MFDILEMRDHPVYTEMQKCVTSKDQQQKEKLFKLMHQSVSSAQHLANVTVAFYVACRYAKFCGYVNVDASDKIRGIKLITEPFEYDPEYSNLQAILEKPCDDLEVKCKELVSE